MTKRFTYEEHKKKMRELLTPPAQTGNLIDRLREVARRRKLPRLPKI